MIYTTILHPVRKQFGISCNDYCIADMIYNLSANPAAPILGWCNASRQHLADAMGLARKSVIEIINKLEVKGLIERQQATDYLRTTSLWYDAVTGCKEKLQGVTKGDSNKRLQGVTKGYTPCEERLQEGVTKGDTIIKEDNNIYKDTITTDPENQKLAEARSDDSSLNDLSKKNEQGRADGSEQSDDPQWLKDQKEKQKQTMKPSSLLTWGEAEAAIQKNEECKRIAESTKKANQAFNWTFDGLLTAFLTYNKGTYGEVSNWKSEAAARKNFIQWLPKFLANNKAPIVEASQTSTRQSNLDLLNRLSQ